MGQHPNARRKEVTVDDKEVGEEKKFGPLFCLFLFIISLLGLCFCCTFAAVVILVIVAANHKGEEKGRIRM